MFDQEELRGYCSNRCMVGSRLYRHQLSEESLYMRGREFKIDVVVLPPGQDEEDLADVLSRATLTGDGERKGLAGWYRESQMAKMNIPREVSEANALSIMEHESVPATFDVAEELGELQFADIEGFAPEADMARIKKNVGRINKLEARKERLAAASAAAPKSTAKAEGAQAIVARKMTFSADKGKGVSGKSKSKSKADASNDDEEGVLKIVAQGRDIDPRRVLEPSDASSASEYDSSWSDDDGDDEASKGDKGLFSGIFGARSSAGMPLTQFGRMWTLMDRISTECTQRYLRDLRQSLSDGGSGVLDETEYFVLPGDSSMAMRHSIMLDGVMGELNGVAGRLNIETVLRQEIGALVSTLDLESNMAVFKKHEYQALCVLFILALSRSMEGLRSQLDRKETLAELEKMSGDLGTDASSLRMISQRLCESY
ncbi:hypothetical protein LPJ56_004147 [Coemansia sp. RSA 2599]|nr:hypothetical protein LPJ56_004147 [Coemansia sp. RSA 2599]